MVVSKEWNWKAENGLYWLDPCEESYYYSNKWKKEGLRSILDLGSGLGRHSILFAREGFQVTAVELSEYGVKHLIEWQKREGLDILTKHCDMKQLPFSDNAFDCIWANCETCRSCYKHCPTGAIREDRFLIDNEKCLSAMNEIPGAFPEWLPLDVHHTLYDCLQCQVHCPMNRDYLKTAIGPICFDEEETEALLSGTPFESFRPELKEKSRLLGLTQWQEALPRNLSILFDTYEEDRYLKYLP